MWRFKIRETNYVKIREISYLSTAEIKTTYVLFSCILLDT